MRTQISRFYLYHPAYQSTQLREGWQRKNKHIHTHTHTHTHTDTHWGFFYLHCPPGSCFRKTKYIWPWGSLQQLQFSILSNILWLLHCCISSLLHSFLIPQNTHIGRPTPILRTIKLFLFQQQRKLRPELRWFKHKNLVQMLTAAITLPRSKYDKMEYTLTGKNLCPSATLSCQVTLSFLPLLHNHVMKAPDVIHIHKKADLGLIKDPFFICVANSFLKNRQNAICRRIKDEKENVLFCL